MAGTYTQLSLHSTDTYRHLCSTAGGALSITPGGQFTPSATIMFPALHTGAFAPAIDACDRLIEELQALRADMLRQAVATDPAYAEAK